MNIPNPYDWNTEFYVLKVTTWVQALERPQLFIENGNPVAMLCAVNETKDHSYNVQIPLKNNYSQ